VRRSATVEAPWSIRRKWPDRRPRGEETTRADCRLPTSAADVDLKRLPWRHGNRRAGMAAQPAKSTLRTVGVNRDAGNPGGNNEALRSAGVLEALRASDGVIVGKNGTRTETERTGDKECQNENAPSRSTSPDPGRHGRRLSGASHLRPYPLRDMLSIVLSASPRVPLHSTAPLPRRPDLLGTGLEKPAVAERSERSLNSGGGRNSFVTRENPYS
jgi:hypothetical protein